MSGHDDIHFPKGAGWGAAALIGFILLATASVRLGWLPQVADPAVARAEADARPIAARDLHFRDRADGAVVVTDLAGAVVAVIDPISEQGFVRGLMRGLARERRLHEAPTTTPFRLQSWSNNSLTLTDLATGREIELGSFGPTNRAAFAVMLPPQATQA